MTMRINSCAWRASHILTAITLRGVRGRGGKPQIAKANIYTAAAVGDVAAVTDLLTKNADVHAKGGPFDWEPLVPISGLKIGYAQSAYHGSGSFAQAAIAFPMLPPVMELPEVIKVEQQQRHF